MKRLNDTLPVWQFWAGILLTLLGTYCTYQHAKEQRFDAQRAQASSFLKDISSAVSEVRQNLTSFQSMWLAIEGCLRRVQASARACSARSDFDDGVLKKAWANLDANIAAAAPFLDVAEAQLLDKLRSVKTSHRDALAKLLLADDTADNAKAIRLQTDTTIEDLDEAEKALRMEISKRLTTKP